MKLRLHFSFVFFNSLLFLFRENGIISCFYAACLLHETGHLIGVLLLKVKLISVDFKGSGICITARKNAAAPISRDIFLLLSGPLVNLLCFAVFLPFGELHNFAEISLWLGIYNLLPYRSLDGGCIVETLICGTAFEREAELIRKVIAAVTTFFLLAGAFFSVTK